MNKIQVVMIITGMLLVSGCAARKPHVVLDPTGVDMGVYQADLNQCIEIAKQVDSKALKGAVGGAVVGNVAGNIIGDSKTGRKGAKLGALSGLIKGAIVTKHERQKIVKNCLRHKGYAVLN